MAQNTQAPDTQVQNTRATAAVPAARREASVERKTKETEISARVQLDGKGAARIVTGVGFFDHMLDQVARHGLFDIELACKGDYQIDDHHSVEDCGIVLGQAFAKALGDKRGIARYASAYTPMDETLSRVVIDLSNRPFLVWEVDFPTEKIGAFDTQLVREFFQAFAQNAGATLHVACLYGANSHHIAESCFKGLARALKDAVALDPRKAGQLPSTKGLL